MSKERYYGGTSSAFITALVALQRAQGVPLDEAFHKAVTVHGDMLSRRGNDTFGTGQLLEYLRLFEKS